MKPGHAKPGVVMVHGAFCGGWAFDAFRRPFEAEGYRVETPDLRGHGPGEPASAVIGLSMSDYARDIAARIAEAPAPPVLVGHSMGGLVAMMAAARAEVSALVLLAPSPPWGVMGGTLEEAGSALALYGLGPFWAQAVEPDRFIAKLYSLDRMEPEAGRRIARAMRPESGRAMFETLNWWLDPFMTTSVNPDAIRAPVFVAVGEKDLIHPPSTVRQTARRLGADAHILPAMSHWLIGEPGWEAVAGTVVGWLGEAEMG